MVYTPQTNWKYDKNLYHPIQSGPQRTGDDLNLRETYLTISSGYTTPSEINQTWDGVILVGADFGNVSSGPPNLIVEPTQIVESHLVKVETTYFENWVASGFLSGCVNSGYDNLPSGCYSGTADPSCAITYPVGPSGELPSGCQVIYASGIEASGTRTEFFIDNVPVPQLQLKKGAIYIFDQSDASNASNQFLFSTQPDGYHVVTNSGYWVASGVLSGCTNSGYDNLPSGCYSGTLNDSCSITYPVGPSGELPSGCVVVYPSGFVDVLSSGALYTDGVVTSGVAGSAGAKVYFTVPSSAPYSLYYFGATTSGIGSSFRVVAPLETRPWYFSTDWRSVPPAPSGYWTNYENTQPHASGLLDSYVGFRAQGLYRTANATVQTALGPQPGLRNFGTHTWYGEQVPDNQIYSPFQTPSSNDNTLDGGGITGGGITHPTVASPTLTNPTNDTSGSRAAWVYHYPVHCQSFTETRYTGVPGQMGQPVRNSYRGKSLRYVPNYGSVYGVLGEGVRNMVRTFSPGTKI